jgi:predicted dehydrogenase
VLWRSNVYRLYDGTRWTTGGGQLTRLQGPPWTVAEQTQATRADRVRLRTTPDGTVWAPGEPVEVDAAASMGDRFPTAGRDCEETTVLTVRHASGMLTSHVHNWSFPGALMQTQVVGPGYDLTWHMQFNERLTGTLDGQPIDETRPGDMYRLQLEGFVRAVAEKDASALRSPYPDAVRSLAVCAAAAVSVTSGRRVAVGAAPP